MLSRLGLAISRVFERTAPDPFVIAILLTIVTAVLALAWGVFPANVSGLFDRAEYLLDVWRFDDSKPAAERLGIWKLLEFAMQMCLILVTGHALAVTRIMRKGIETIAGLPRSTAAAAAMVGFVACALALVNWGLGLIVGALLARAVGKSMAKRGIAAHYPLIVAAGYTGLMVWHGGLSGSAPLTMTTAAGASKALPASVAAQFPEGVPLSDTLFSPMNLLVTGGLLLIVPVVLAMLAPKRTEDMRPMVDVDDAATAIHAAEGDKSSTLPDRLDRSWVIVWLLALPLIFGLVRFAQTRGLNATGLNEINAAMLALGLILHGSPRAYMQAAEAGARGCAGILIQFPLYAGIMGLMQASGLAAQLAQSFTAIGNESTIPLLSFSSSGVVNMFVPSGGGQWAIQGPIALEAGASAAIDPGMMIMSVAYGDQLTNMLQPFWALPLLAITGARARDIVGYTAVVMLVGGLWMAAGLLLF